MRKVGEKIVKYRVPIFILALVLLIPAGIGYLRTRVNYDVLSYLPDSIETMQGQDILQEQFGTAAYSMLICEGMSEKDVSALKEKVEEVEHVEKVVWYDSLLDISIPMDMLPDKIYGMFNSDDSTMMFVIFDTTTSADETMDAVKEIRSLAGTQCFLSGMSSVVTDTRDLVDSEVGIYVLIAVILSAIVLALAMDSFFLPVVFLLGIGFAVIYNLGTNIFMGEISYITQALAAVLQLGVTMDYSIFLWHSYQEELTHTDDREEAMAISIDKTFKSVAGSSLTTIAGFLALCFMTFRLGLDLGIVMMKGVFLGVLCCVTILPAMIMIFDRVLEKTRHRPIIPELNRLSDWITKHYVIFAVLLAALIVPAYYCQNNASVYYNLDRTLPEDLPSSQANTKPSEEYNMGAIHMLLIDSSMTSKQIRAMTDEMELADGVNELRVSCQELIDGMEEIDENMGTLNDGAAALNSGKDELIAGGEELLSGLNSLNDQKSSLVSGITSLDEGIRTLNTQKSSLISGINTLNNGLGTLNTKKDSLISGIKSLAEGIDQLDEGKGTLVSGVNSLASGSSKLYKGAKSLEKGVDSYTGGADQLKESLDAYVDGSMTLASGVTSYVAGVTGTDGQTGLADGVTSYVAGVNEILTGIRQLNTALNSSGAENTSDVATSTASDAPGTACEALQKSIAGNQAVLSSLQDVQANLPQLLEAFSQYAGTYNTYVQQLANDIAQLQSDIANQQAALEQLQAVSSQMSAAESSSTEMTQVFSTVKNGVAALSQAIDTYSLTAAGQALTEGAAKLNDATTVAALNSAAESLLANGEALKSGAEQLTGQSETLMEGASSITAAAKQVSEGATRLKSKAASLSDGVGELADGAGQLSTGADTLSSGISQLASGGNQLADGAGTLSSGIQELADGSSLLAAAAPTLSNGIGELADGGKSLLDGINELGSGIEELADGSSLLKDGTAQLADGGAALDDGTKELADGASELADGMKEFNEEGIEKLTDTLEEDVQDILDRLKELKEAGADYSGFASSDVTGDVKFIIETEGIEEEEQAEK